MISNDHQALSTDNFLLFRSSINLIHQINPWTKEEVEEIRNELSSYVETETLNNFEVAQLINYLPEDNEKAREVVPSLSDLEVAELDDIIQILNKYRDIHN
eukprot:TRINITY_DN2559_c0_g1_i2.p1 TRINITY_DN2559_c0_g1~~TRINITY_DN2559_c0_g1_i2.p1  ORF type:complete len:101 (+),score=42.84 TRINITY_DN2559_c0_g1_i2:171-473(+)